MKDIAYNFSLMSIAYIVTYSLTFGFVFPLQKILLSDVSTQIGLLFLPHGVRVMTLYFYGWRGMLYLLPASYLMLFLSIESTGLNIFAPIVSLVCCYAGIQGARLLFSETISVTFNIRDWKLLLWGGVIASIFNGLGLLLLNRIVVDEISALVFPLMDLLGYIIGDVLGLVLCLGFLMYFFRIARHLKLS